MYTAEAKLIITFCLHTFYSTLFKLKLCLASTSHIICSTVLFILIQNYLIKNILDDTSAPLDLF